MRRFGCIAIAAAAAMAVLAVAHADTLGTVRHAGVLRCASNGADEDYTRADTHGDLTDLAEAICRAVAVAVLGPDGKATVHAWPDERHMLESLRAGTSDLAVGTTPTAATALAFNVAYAPPVFYDGLGILLANGTAGLSGLAGKPICFLGDAGMGESLRFAMQSRHIDYAPFPFEEVGEMSAAAGDGRCAAIAGNVSQLINLGTGYAPIEKRFRLLPDVLTKDPLAPAYRADDPAWGIVVDAVVNVLIQADESGVTAANARAMAGSEDPLVQGMIGARSRLGRAMGLPDDWAVTVLRAVGNYGEIFGRTLGADSDFGLPRGLNQPVSRGGAMLAMPLQ